MKFTVSTKPLQDGLNLGIVNANVSKFYQKSWLAQITADANTLTVNVEATDIMSEIILKGSGDTKNKSMVSVDCLILKQLVNTFDATTTIFEFVEGGLVLHSGKSKFTLPQLLEADEFQLKRPESNYLAASSVDVTKSDWKFVKDYQMYAISMSHINPVYTKVWIGENGEVMVCDMDLGLFTVSKKSKLGKTCLLSDTIINLFCALPDGAKLYRLNTTYVVAVKTDGFEFVSEFLPTYESEVLDYNSVILLNTLKVDDKNSVQITASQINTVLGQAALLSNTSDAVIKFTITKGELVLEDGNVDCKVKADSKINFAEVDEYSLLFRTALLKQVMSNCSENEISICPNKIVDDENTYVTGIVIDSKDVIIALAGVE